ncbi:MAG: NADP-dependent malic enzyme, partial [Duncaniella sp.]|nr:NADP-dependent malic enzyme [Duncaniella sp.]
RLLTAVSPAVARGAMDSGVARRPIEDWDAYDEKLLRLKGNDRKFTRRLNEVARTNPKRVVFADANTDNMLRAAAIAAADGLCIPLLLGNEEMIGKRAERLGLDISGIEIVNLRHDREAPRRERYARMLAEKRQRQGENFEAALEKMFDRAYFGMMMVENGDADAFIAGIRSASNNTSAIAREVVGIREGYNHFASLHVLETSKGTYFLADTMINGEADEETLYDITRLTADAVKFFAHDPVMALVSYSNFGSNRDPECVRVHNVVDRIQAERPDLPIDGEMQINYAFNTPVRDKVFPFNRLKGKEVNTLVFPNLAAANAAYRIMLEMGVGESIGPIQMGLKKPIHFINVDAEVRDIINLIAVAVLDATAAEDRAY